MGANNVDDCVIVNKRGGAMFGFNGLARRFLGKREPQTKETAKQTRNSAVCLKVDVHNACLRPLSAMPQNCDKRHTEWGHYCCISDGQVTLENVQSCFAEIRLSNQD